MENKIARGSKNARSVSAYLSLYIFKVLVPFITLPVYTRLIAPEAYGRLALAMLFGTVVSGLANLGMSVAFDREYFKLGTDSRQINLLVLTNISFTFVVFSLLLVPTVIFRSGISQLLTRAPDNGWLIVGASVVSYVNLLFVEFCLNYWRNGQKVRVYLTYAIVNLVLDVLVGMILVIVFHLGIIGLLIAHAFSGGVLVLFFLAANFDWRNRWDWRVLRSSLLIAYPLTPRVFIGVLSTQFDKYILSLLGTMGGVGVYDIGKRLSEQVFSFMTALQGVFLPQVYQKLFASTTKDKHGIGTFLTPFLFLSFLVALGFVLFSEELIRLLLPSSYFGAIAIVAPLSISFAAMFFGKITGQQFIYTKKTHLSLLLSLVNTAFNVGLCIPFVYLYGPVGAAIAAAIASIASNAISVIIAQRICKVDWEGRKILVLTVVLLLAAGGVLVTWFLHIDYIWRLLFKLAVAAVFLILGNRFGILTRGNVAEFLRSLNIGRRFAASGE